MSVLLFILGLLFGSFFSAYSYRYPRRLSVIFGRSFCDKCKKDLAWYENIPLISYLLLKGRCRNCNKKISIRYPLIELTTAFGFLLIGWNVFWLTIFAILLLIFIIDMENQIIPDELIFLGLTLNTIYYIQYTNLLAGFLCASILLLIHLLTRGRGMGLGDVKFAVLGGVTVGLNLSLIWLLLAFLTGGIIAIILILWGKKGLKDKIAFGPFLVVAIPLSHWWNLSSLSRLFPF